jgi:hypothetical protein
MATNDYLVYVPDRADAIRMPRSMTVEEVRGALVGTGFTALENATANVSADGQTIRFQRVVGGNKGSF